MLIITLIRFLTHGCLFLLWQAQHGLTDHDNYHELCRLLARLKANYQLSELVQVRAIYLSIHPFIYLFQHIRTYIYILANINR